MFNLEVEGDHCYRVGQQGLLVHNASWSGCNPCKDAKPKANVSLSSYLFTYDEAQVEETPGAKTPRVCRVLKASGKISKQPSSRDEPGRESRNARDDVTRFFFNNPPKAGLKPSTAQESAGNNKAGGHIIADSLGGPNIPQNIVPFVHEGFNTHGAWSKMERYITACLNNALLTTTAKIINPLINTEGFIEVNLEYKSGPIPETATELEILQYYIPVRIYGSFTLTNAMGTVQKNEFNFPNSATAQASYYTDKGKRVPPNCGFGQSS